MSEMTREERWPRGLTRRRIAQLFQSGYSVLGLAKRFQIEEWEVQHAIREVMRRTAKPGGAG